MPSRETQRLSFFYKEPRYPVEGKSSPFIGTTFEFLAHEKNRQLTAFGKLIRCVHGSKSLFTTALPSNGC